MKKLFLLLFIIISIWLNSSVSALETIYWWWPNNWTDCWNSKVPKDADTYKSWSSYTCVSHNYYPTWDYYKNTSKNSMTMCNWEDRAVWKSWTKLRCRKYDDVKPDSVSISYDLWAIQQWSYDITVKAKDNWWSNLKKISIYENDNWSWNSTPIKTWDNINIWNNIVTKTYKKTNANNWHRYKYKAIVYDYANHSVMIEKPDIIRVIKELELEDNDNYVRKNINWIIYPKYNKNIFWNNHKIEDYINKNPNNTDNFNVKLWDVDNWFLNMELNGNAQLKIIRINKDRYKNFKEFEKTLILTWTINAWNGYIKSNSGALEISNNIWEAYSFNFKTHDYILMLENLDENNMIKYNINWTNHDWKWIYINPINDSNTNQKWFKILGYDIIINNRWNIMWKMLEMVWKK